MKSLLRVLTYIRPYWGLAALTFAAATTAAAIELLPPWLLKIIIDDVIGGNRAGLLPWVIAGLLGAHIGKNVASSLRIRFNNTLEQRVIYDLRDQVFTALQRLSINYYENRSTGEIMNRVNNDVEHVERIFIDGIESLLMSSLTLIGISAILFSLNWKLALLSLLPIPVLVFSASYFTGRVHKFYRGVRESSAELNAYLQDAISGIRETMGFNRETYERERFNHRSKTYSDSNLRVMTLWSMYSPSMIVVGSLGSVIILWYGGQRVVAGAIRRGQFVQFIFYLGTLAWPMIALGWVVNLFERGRASLQRLDHILDMQPEVRDNAEAQQHSGAVDIQGTIEFRNLNFAYNGTPVLRNISLNIPKGRTLAIVGATGSGKSSLVQLIPRLHNAPPETLYVDGIAIEKIPLASLRRSIGYIPQDTFLFGETVRENIAFGVPGATDAQVQHAAQVSNIQQDIEQFPMGFNTMVGERGITLSGGQKQRTAISRAVIRDPRILVLDDALSSVDTYTEEQILHELKTVMKGRTSILISHRVSTVKEADEIVVLDRGEIVERGTHDELLEKGGYYADLHRRQLLEEEIEVSE